MISQELLQTYIKVHPQYHNFQLVVVGLNDGDGGNVKRETDKILPDKISNITYL